MKKKIIAFTLMFSGFGLIGYSIYLVDTFVMTVGFILVWISMVVGFVVEINESYDRILNQKKIYNDIIDLIKDDKLKEAYDKCKNELIGEKDKTYINGLIFGRKLTGDDITQLKIDLSDDKN